MAIDDDHITSILPQYRKQENPSTLDAALNQSIINIDTVACYINNALFLLRDPSNHVSFCDICGDGRMNLHTSSTSFDGVNVMQRNLR